MCNGGLTSNFGGDWLDYLPLPIPFLARACFLTTPCTPIQCYTAICLYPPHANTGCNCPVTLLITLSGNSVS